MSARRKDKGDCAIDECGEPAHVRGLCLACYSAWFRLRDKTIAQARDYLWRTKRLATRVPILVGARKQDDPHWDVTAHTQAQTPKVRHIRHVRGAA